MKKIAKSIKIKSYRIIKNKKGNIIKFLDKKNNLSRFWRNIFFRNKKKSNEKLELS